MQPLRQFVHAILPVLGIGCCATVSYIGDGVILFEVSCMPDVDSFITGDLTNEDTTAMDAVRQLAFSADVQLKSKTGLGSGFFVDKSGYALTAHHVLQDQSSIEGKTGNGQTVTFDVKLTDPKNDLAVLKAREMPKKVGVLRLGESLLMTPGDPIMAVGHPLGQEGHAAKEGMYYGYAGRSGALAGRVFSDSVAWQGNSGGSLLNSDGEVVGVVSFKTHNVTGSISSEMAMELLAKADPQRFTVTHSPDGLAGMHLNFLKEHPYVGAAIDTAAASVAGYGAWRACAASRGWTGAGAVAVGAGMAWRDLKNAIDSRTQPELLKYSVATGADLGIAASGLGLLLKAGRPQVFLGTLALSAAARIGAEFVPTRTQLSIHDSP